MTLPMPRRLHVVFVILAALCVLMVLIRLAQQFYATGTLAGAFDVSSRQLVFVLSLVSVYVLTMYVTRKLAPPGSLLSAAYWGEEESRAYGGIGGVMFGITLFLTQYMVSNFYWRWTLRFLVFEIGFFAAVIWVNRRKGSGRKLTVRDV
jgi:hypothetical protein